MNRDVQILEQFAQTLVPEIQAVSGRFAESIEHEINETPTGLEFLILASPYISVLIDGRPPTKMGAKKGSPTLREIIFDWIKQKGIQARPDRNGNTPSQEALSYAITNSIHRYGTLLYQRGGGKNIFDAIITQSRLDSVFVALSKEYFTIIESEILKHLK